MAEWIWIGDAPKSNEYGYFCCEFDGRPGLTLKIAAESDYAAYLNGKLLGFNAFAGYRNEKYYDSYELSECAEGKNLLEITVRYEGLNSSVHIDDGAGLYFEIPGVCGSGKDTLCAPDTRYVNYELRRITPQLGYASDMCAAAKPSVLHEAVLTGRKCVLKPRPVKKLELKSFAEGREIKPGLYDLGRETAGYMMLECEADIETVIEVAYGEHIEDGCVRQKIGSRDFSLRFKTAPGRNNFTQLFVRVAGRYLEAHAPKGVKITRIGLVPAEYPQKVKSHSFTGLDARIYDTCIATLRLCMHTHYEDCPWREQALYTMDSRNQMLCGYYAFEETSFQRANLVFISKGLRPDGLLELTYPTVNSPAIPFFSLVYPIEVLEYMEHTGDYSIAAEVKGTLESIFKAMMAQQRSNGLIENLPVPYWNFYEWIDGSDGHKELGSTEIHPERYDLILNCAYVLAAEAVKKICALAGIDAPDTCETRVKAAIREVFADGDTFVSSTLDKRKTRLGNALACLAGLGNKNTRRALMHDETLLPETLSMSAFVYDAILEEPGEGKTYVLNDIRTKYSSMLEKGATSFWETIKGAADFDGAGSLCHGWSAIPIIYLRKFAEETEK